MALAIQNSNIPFARELEVGGIYLDAYYDPNADEFFFSASQLSRTFSDGKAGGVQFLSSRRAEPILEATSVTSRGVEIIECMDIRGVIQEVKALTVAQASLYIIDLVRKKASKKAQLVASVLVVRSLQKFCEDLFDLERDDAAYDRNTAEVVSVFNERHDCCVHDLEVDCRLLTSTELAGVLGYEIGKNGHRLASWMVHAFPEGDRLMGRRLYNVEDRMVRDCVADFFLGQALKEIHFAKQAYPDVFDDMLINNFSDL